MFKRSLHAAFLAVFLVFFSVQPVLAWGQTGHRITGRIAELEISGATRQALMDLFGHTNLAHMSTWADDQRSNPDAPWYGENGDRHWAVIKRDGSYPGPTRGSGVDALTSLEYFKGILKDPAASKDQKRDALRWAVHILGDIHQPLHLGNGEDAGGNAVRLSWQGRSSSLHRVWDTDMINAVGYSYSEFADVLIEDMDLRGPEWKAAQRARTLKDVEATAVAMRSQVYDLVDEDLSRNGLQLGYGYLYKNKPAVALQLQRAGLFIATWLDEVLA